MPFINVGGVVAYVPAQPLLNNTRQLFGNLLGKAINTPGYGVMKLSPDELMISERIAQSGAREVYSISLVDLLPDIEATLGPDATPTISDFIALDPSNQKGWRAIFEDLRYKLPKP